ncbi:MAG: hypothetical protein ACI4TK_18590 [Agathobacter sp.]
MNQSVLTMTTNNMTFIGYLQVFAKPFASLYYNNEAKLPVVLVRISSLKDTDAKYAAKATTFDWLKKYMNKRVGLRAMFRKGSDYTVYTDGSCVVGIGPEKSIPHGTFKSQERFNPEFCYNMPEIQCFINSKTDKI